MGRRAAARKAIGLRARARMTLVITDARTYIGPVPVECLLQALCIIMTQTLLLRARLNFMLDD